LKLLAEHLFTWRQRFKERKHMMKKQICGLLELYCLNL